jgi:cytoskeleton protein RodZ
MASTAMPSGASGANASPPSAPSPAGAAAKGTESKAVETKGADTKAASAATPATGQATQVAANNPAPAKGDRRLHFTFKGESWVEVRDASGRVVFRQLNPAGSEASVSGKPPLQVVVGNAEEVELEKDGKPFDLAPATDTDVARFKVE